MKITDAVFCVVDTETTGLDPAVDELLEIGALLVDYQGREVGPEFEALVAPSKPLTPDNSAIHGLIDEDFIYARDRKSVEAQFRRFICDDPWRADCLVAHNMAFDAGFLPTTLDLAPSLCTKRLAMHVVPDAPNHKNQTLRYYFRDVARRADILALGDAHRAISDARVTAAILGKVLPLYLSQGGEDDIGALIAYAESPVILKALPFGKHRGVPFAVADQRYLAWMLRNIPDLDRDMRFTIESTLRDHADGAA